MSKALAELDSLLLALIAEHEKLLRLLDSQQQAMRKLDLRAMEAAGQAQEASRMKIAALETRRRIVAGQLALVLKIDGAVTITRLAEAMPAARPRLLQLATRLRDLATQITGRAQVAGRVAGTVLGHLNTVVRLIAGAVEQAGLYTKQGVPQVSARIGVLEAVG